MKRYTTAQAIAALSKPGREGWYAEATGNPRLSDERITHESAYFTFENMISGHNCSGWATTATPSKRPDWRIIKPKREKMILIGGTGAPFSLTKSIHDLEKTGDEYEIFARRVGK